MVAAGGKSAPGVADARALLHPGGDPYRVVKRKHPGRWVAAVVVLAVLVALVAAFATSPNIHWNVVGQYLTNGSILNGIKLTILLTVVSQAIGIVGGVLLAVMAQSENVVTKSVSGLYIWAFRGTPLLVQIIFWFNLALIFPHLGLHLPGTPVDLTWSTNSLITPVTAAIIALGLNEASYMAEIVRGGLLSVEQGQVEAATAVGMTRMMTLRQVVLPQALRVIVPPTGNELINMLKNTSLVSVIAARELLTSAQQIYATNFMTIELLIVASIWYLVMSSICSIGQSYLERRLRVVLRVRSKRWSTRTAKKVSARFTGLMIGPASGRKA